MKAWEWERWTEGQTKILFVWSEILGKAYFYAMVDMIIPSFNYRSIF